MRLENEFEVPAPPADAWALLNDVPRVIPCMPGAALAETVDDSHWKATMHVKLGPISLQFATDVERTESDPAAQRAVLSAKARELKGRGGANARIESTLGAAENGGTKVTIATDLTLQGTVAQYGRGVVGDVANQLVKRFADCLAAQLQEERNGDEPAPPPPAAPEPVGGLSLAAGAILRRLLALLRRR
jgi:carbon monoxide dehydrogenase subunit G